jgi:hypothetical protein
MTSLAKLGSGARFRWLLDLGPMCLIVGGFMAAAAAMFWTFTQAPELPARAAAIQQVQFEAPPEMICECTLEVTAGFN